MIDFIGTVVAQHAKWLSGISLVLALITYTMGHLSWQLAPQNDQYLVLLLSSIFALLLGLGFAGIALYEKEKDNSEVSV